VVHFPFDETTPTHHCQTSSAHHCEGHSQYCRNHCKHYCGGNEYFNKPSIVSSPTTFSFAYFDHDHGVGRHTHYNYSTNHSSNLYTFNYYNPNFTNYISCSPGVNDYRNPNAPQPG